MRVGENIMQLYRFASQAFRGGVTGLSWRRHSCTNVERTVIQRIQGVWLVKEENYADDDV